jgi:hypothetical protein
VDCWVGADGSDTVHCFSIVVHDFSHTQCADIVDCSTRLCQCACSKGIMQR